MGCGQWLSYCQGESKPAHTVALNGFWLGKHEVTVGQYQKCMQEGECEPPEWLQPESKYHYQHGSDNNHFRSLGKALTATDHPIVGVSWENARQMVRWMTGKNAITFRLPSESEWEYACRSGGREEEYSGGDSINRVAWHRFNSGGRTHRVGEKIANKLGLFDMSGNIAEWVQDIRAAYTPEAKNNPINLSGGIRRIVRGGDWDGLPLTVSCGYRFARLPDGRYSWIGFRLAWSKQESYQQ